MLQTGIDKRMQKRLNDFKQYFSLQKLGGDFKHFLFSPLLGEDSHFDEHIFQVGWFNHQPEKDFVVLVFRFSG